MSGRTRTMMSWLVVALLAATFVPVASADEAVDKAFAALAGYDWGSDRAAIKPIDDAVVGSHGDDAAREALEGRLAEVLAGDAPQAAKDYVCRQLSLIGTAKCVPAVAALLGDEKLSHMARFALERIPDAAAVAAMRDALPNVSGKVKIGVINSLGVRRDAESVSALAGLLGDGDVQIAAAAAGAIGAIGNGDAAKALAGFDAPEALVLAVADAQLACAEQLLADGKKLDAVKIYTALSKPEMPKHIRVAATRGRLAALKAK